MKATLTSVFFLLITLISYGQTNTATDYCNKAHQLIKKEKYTEALQVLTDGINAFPDSARLYDDRGVLLEAFRRYDEAIKDFSKAIERSNTEKSRAHYLANRGGTKCKVRDFEGAYKDLVEATRLNPSNVAALNNLAMACKSLNKTDEALKYLFQIVAVDSLNAIAYMNIGFTYQGMNEHTKAIEYFNKALSLDPDAPYAYSNRAFSKLRTNDLKGAMKDINQSLKLDPTNSYAYKNRALIYIEEKKYKDACADLQKANELGYTRQYGKEVNELMSKYCN